MSAWKKAYALYRRAQVLWPAQLPDWRHPVDAFRGFMHDGFERQTARWEPWAPRPKGELKETILGWIEALQGTNDPQLRTDFLWDHTYDDAYHAAHALAFSSYLKTGRGHAYRGQRKPWKVQASIFVSRDGAPLDEAEFNRRLANVGAFVDLLAATPELAARIPTEEQRVAAAQHYGIPTWLVDVTSDPFIALFFATLRGQPGDVGVVMHFSTGEIEILGAGGRNRLGAMRAIAAPAVRRLQAQKGFFIEGSHPDVIAQYSAVKLHFHQQAGLVFEDPTMGITAASLLHAHGDPLAQLADEFRAGAAARMASPGRSTLAGAPDFAASHPVTAADYLGIVESWLARFQSAPLPRPLPRGGENVLQRLCAFHAELQLRQVQLSLSPRSIHRLAEAASYLAVQSIEPILRPPDFRQIVNDHYATHASPAEKIILAALVQHIERGEP